jgi:hypothetical protein
MSFFTASNERTPPAAEGHTTSTAITASPVTVLQKTKRLLTVTYMTNKQRELIAKWQASGHYVRPSQQVDVVRYGKSGRSRSVVQAVLDSMKSHNTVSTSNMDSGPGAVGSMSSTTDSMNMNGMNGMNNMTSNSINKLATDERYVPLELAQATGRLSRGPKKSLRTATLEQLAQRERTDGAGGGQAGVDGDEEDLDEDAVLEEPQEEEDGEDYTTNYYASDDDDGGDDDGGGDAEPTF